MLKRLIAILDRPEDRLQPLVRDFAENYGVLILLGAVVASLSFCSTAFVRW